MTAARRRKGTPRTMRCYVEVEENGRAGREAGLSPGSEVADG